VALFKKIRALLHPIVNPFFQWYLSKPRTFRYQKIIVRVRPTVFHPGLFYSTKLILAFLDQRVLKNKKVLELGAGTGLIAIHCARQGAVVTATDINPHAISNIRENAELNSVSIDIVHSDLLTTVSPKDFDIIVINPPYYPKKIGSEKDYAWYCGENFEYFRNLFFQIKEKYSAETEIIMVLSEDCNISQIKAIAEEHDLEMPMLYSQQILGESNFIFRIQNLVLSRRSS
jgi:release factor glutamine methyltransferase